MVVFSWAKMVVIEQKLLYSVKVVVFGQSGCNRAKLVVFEKKWFYSDKVVVYG